MKPARQNRYVVKSVIHASEVLCAFQSPGEVLGLREVVERTRLSKGMCFRFLYTLHECGFVEKLGENRYRRSWEMHPKRQFRIGYASQGQDSSFGRVVLDGLIGAAQNAGMELIVADNRYDAKIALRSADYLIRERVDLAIEFQTDDSVAVAIASKYMEAGIPFIAIDIPHPGATYFGANNYYAGLMAGRQLGRWAKKNWDGLVDEILLLEIARAGSIPRSRVRGMLEGIKETIRIPDQTPIVTLDGDGQFKTAQDVIRKHLRSSKTKRVLVGAANDPSAIGALRAFQEAGRAAHCSIVGHNAEPEARTELREPQTRLVGSVAFFPDKYGEELIRIAVDILSHKPVPPVLFVKNRMITPENVDHLYPNDELLGVASAQV